MRFIQNCILTILIMLGLVAIFQPNNQPSIPIEPQPKNITEYQSPEIESINQAFEDIRSVQVPPPPYFARIRFVIETDKNGRLARTPEQIGRDLEIAKQIFAPILLDFIAVEAVQLPHEETTSIRDYRYNAKLNNTSISVYYIFGHRSLTPAGLSAFPWGEDKYGILINGKYASHSTLAHELGHYFGLYHTFQEGSRKDDHVPDTLTEDDWRTLHGENKPYTDYKNLMNYGQRGETRLTRGQLERVRFYLTTFRQEVIFTDPLFFNILQPEFIDITSESEFNILSTESE